MKPKRQSGEWKGSEQFCRGEAVEMISWIFIDKVFFSFSFFMCTFESAGSCWCCHPDLRVLLTSAVVREQPFLHIPGAVEDNCCGLCEGEALKKHFHQTSVA